MNDTPLPAPAAPPFKYFDYFQESEQDFFAGREDEIQEVLTGVSRSRTFVLYGRSGIGKTSLLFAGLFPRWRQRGFHPIEVRLLESPVEELCAALAIELQCPSLTREQVPRVLVEHSAREPLLIVLDHFEEFFIRYADRTRESQEFIALLGSIYREGAANVRFVFCLSEDYYARLEELRGELPDLTEHGLRLLPPTAYGARQAILRPLVRAGAHYEDAFVNALVDQLADWHFEPFALQISCAELYRDAVERQGLPVRLAREDLERMGNVGGILSEYFRRMGSGFEAERLLLVGAVLEGLISPEHTRRTVRAEEVHAGPVRASLEEIREELQRFADRRVVRVIQRRDGLWYELMHERLVGLFERLMEDHPDYTRFRMARHLVATLSEGSQWRGDPRWLLSGAQLEERVEPWKERLRLDERETEFVLRSSIHARRDTVPYWASRYDEFGDGRTTELLLRLLAHPQRDVQLGALLTCSRLEDGSGRLTARCLELALESPDEEPRRAAGAVFARLMRPEDAATLQGALETPEWRAQALEVLADLYEAGRPVEGYPRRERFLARFIFRRRRLALNRRSIQQRASIGAFTGARVTLVWAFTVGLALLYILVVTTFPQQVTMLRWSQEFLNEGLGAVFVVGPSLLMPLGVLLGWRVARRTGVLIALHGCEHWGYPTLRSGTVMLSSTMLSWMVLLVVGRTDAMAGLERKLSQPLWLLLFLMALASAFLAWLLTWVLVALGSHCIPRKARTPVIYFWAFLGSGCVPLALEMVLARSALWARSWDIHFASVLSTIAGISAFIASFQSFVVICSLAMARKRLGGENPVPRRPVVLLSRAALLVMAAAVVAGAAIIWGPDTLPSRTKLALGRELSLDGSVWKVRDTDYFTVLGPGARSFAVSVRGEDPRTRLLLNGVDSTHESLLVSAHPQVLAAVTASAEGEAATTGSRRLRYHYELVPEPIRTEIPRRVTRNRWTLVSLPLEVLPPTPGGRPQWQARMESTLSPDWRKEGTEVLVHPVLLELHGMEKGACMGLFGSSDSVREFSNALVMRNRDDAEPVPRPNSQAELFLEGFRLEPGPEGDWSLVMTVSPSSGVEPEECLPARGLTSLVESRRRTSEAGRAPASLIVAVKMY